MAEDEADAVEVMDVLLLVGVEVHLLGVQVHQLRILPLSLAVLLEGEEVAVQDGRYQEEESYEELVEAVSRGKLHDHLEVFDLGLEDVSVVPWAVKVLLFRLEEALIPQAEHFLDQQIPLLEAAGKVFLDSRADDLAVLQQLHPHPIDRLNNLHVIAFQLKCHMEDDFLLLLILFLGPPVPVGPFELLERPSEQYLLEPRRREVKLS